MKKLLITILLIFSVAVSFANTRPYTKNDVHFKGTEYELDVYKIYGRQDGKTILILGGIQGDEPGGFLSADLYADFQLEKGNLIVVPRANFKSVILFDRETEADMNRRFTAEAGDLEMDKVVHVIMELMKESDVFLNLHDGWGYHNPKYIDKWRNPSRFGQSVITDANIFECDDGTMLDLKTPAKKVLEAVNKRIGEERYYLHYFNTETENPMTRFTDMRKTATYYALKNFCLPSFGIESSKNLPSTELKVLHHNYAVNEFMNYYGIVPEYPAVFDRKPVLNYAVIKVNDDVFTLKDKQTVFVNRGDIVEVTNIDSNYERGISCDILGMGDKNDYGKPLEVKGESRIVFRKDSKKIGEIKMVLKQPTKSIQQAETVKPITAPAQAVVSKDQTAPVVFTVSINGNEVKVPSGETIKLNKTDKIIFIGAVGGNFGSTDIPVNVKGFVPAGAVNLGDDRGHEITSNYTFMRKYSKNGEGYIYPVIAGNSRNEIGEIWIEFLK